MTPVELRGITWDHPRGLGGLRATAKAYRQARPEVRVEWTTRSLQAFADQPLDELARRFDLVYVDHPAIGAAVARGCLVPLDERLDEAFLADQIRSSVGRSAASYEWQGHRWALATDAAAQVTAFRPELMERAEVAVPRTWAEAVTTAEALRRRGLWAALPSIPVDAICSFLAVCAALGEAPLQHDRVVSPGVGRDALDVLAAFVAWSHPASLGWNPPATLEHMSGSDDVAFCPLAFGYSNYSRPGFRPHEIRFDGGPAGDDGVPHGTLGGAGLAVSAFGTAVDEAVRYAAFVADPQTQRGAYFEGGGQPGHRAAWMDDQVNSASNGFFRDSLAAVDAAYLRPRYDGFLAFQDEAGELVHAYLRDPGDPGATVDRLEAAYRASLVAERV